MRLHPVSEGSGDTTAVSRIDAEAIVSRSCLGGLLPFSGRILIAAGLVIVPNLDAHTRQHLADPFLLFVPVAWSLLMFASIFPFLRHPRTENFPFLLGLTIEQRRRMASRFLRRGVKHLGEVVAMTIPGYLIVRFFIAGAGAMGWAFSVAALLLASCLVSMGVLLIIDRFSLISPVRHDRGRHLVTIRSSRGLRKFFSGMAASIARQASMLFSGRMRPVVRRQILYLFRYDWFASVFFGIVSLPIAAIVFPILLATQPLAALVFLVSAPAFLFFQITPALAVAAGAARNCPYWWFSPQRLFAANLLVAAGICVPFGIIFFAGSGLPVSIAGVVRAAGFLWALASVVIYFAARWLTQEAGGALTAAFGVMVLCAFMGLVGASAGAALSGFGFPLLSMALCGWNARGIIKEWKKS